MSRSTGRGPMREAAAVPAWQIDARLDGVDPAQLHGQLAASRSTARRAWAAPAATDFELARAPHQRPARRAAGRQDAGAHLAARAAPAVRPRPGRWDAGVLRLDTLRLRTDDAELAGTARRRQGRRRAGGRSRTAPERTRPARQRPGRAACQPGRRQLSAELGDAAARALAWARRLPGSRRWLDDAQAQGRATLQARWRGGWRDPTPDARLSVPSSWTGGGHRQPAAQLRDVQLTADNGDWRRRLERARPDRQERRSAVAQRQRRTQHRRGAAGRLRLAPAGGAMAGRVARSGAGRRAPGNWPAAACCRSMVASAAASSRPARHAHHHHSPDGAGAADLGPCAGRTAS